MDGFQQPASRYESELAEQVSTDGADNQGSDEPDGNNLPVIGTPDDIPGGSEDDSQLYSLLDTGEQVPQPDGIGSDVVPTTSHDGRIQLSQVVDCDTLPNDSTINDDKIELQHDNLIGTTLPSDPSILDDGIESVQENVIGSRNPNDTTELAQNDPTTHDDSTELAQNYPTTQDDRMVLPQDKMDEMMDILKEHNQENLMGNAANTNPSSTIEDNLITDKSTTIKDNINQSSRIEYNINQSSTIEHDTNQTSVIDDNASNKHQLSMIKDYNTSTNQPFSIENQPIAAASDSVQDTSDWCSFKCKFCPKIFPDRKTWKYHNMDEHGLLPYGCRYCDERYEHKNDLKEHERFHKSNRYKHKKSFAQRMAAHLVTETVAQTVTESTARSVTETISQPVTETISQPVTETASLCTTEIVTTSQKATPTVINTDDNPSPTSDDAEESSDQVESNKQSITPTAVAQHIKQAKSPLQAILDKASVRGKKKPRHKTKSDLIKTLKHTSRSIRKKKNVVVVSVLDVMASDAKLVKQGLKAPSGGASGALLNIVDQIRTDHPEHFQKLKGNYRLRAIRKKGLFDDDDELSPADEPEEYTPRKKVKSKSFKRASTKGKKLYGCRVCPRMLSSNKVKIYHERGHPYPHECKFCHRAFQNKRDLEDHESGHVTGSWACRLCPDIFKEYFLFETHQKNHLRDDKDNQAFPCQYCNKAMKSKKSLEVHMRVHTGEKPYQCQFCEKSYRHYESWNYHENKHKGTLKQHVCQFCGKAFGGKYGLQVHERIHTGEKPYKCDHCNLAFSSNEKLKVHKDRVNGLAFVCQFCGKNFFTKANLNQHEMIHKGVKPHKCKSCEASFTSITSLKYHTRTVHTGERYPCKFCNKQCKSKGQLTSHLRSHTDERPFKCKFCNKSFRNSNTLKTHEQGIHLGFRYTCPVCKKDFSQRTALRTHDKLVHQGIKWKDMVLQRKINREQRMMHDAGKLAQAAVDVKFAPGVAPAPPPPMRTNISKLPSRHDLSDMEAIEEEASESVKAQVQALKLYQQHRMGIPHHPPTSVMNEEELSPSTQQSGMDARLTSKQVQQSFGGLQGPIPVSISGCDQSSVDVAYQLATLATSARHLLHVRHSQGHHHVDEALQVHLPGHAHHPGVHVPHGVHHQGDPSGVVDVVFPPDNGPPMYQTL